jgi:nicotinic acid mononucleotide adenylyltransferase
MENDMAAMRRNQGAVILGTISNFLTGTHRVSAVAKILGGATVLAATYVSCGSPGLRSELSDKIELSNRPIESSPADCASPLASGLLRFPKSLAAVEYLDICSAPRQIVDQRISESSPLDERLRVLSERKLHTLITPPGVTFIRDREKVAQISAALDSAKGSVATESAIIVNFVTREAESGAASTASNQTDALPIVSIDVWTGQEALIAMMDSGKTSLLSDGEVGGLKVEVLVNGWLPGKTKQWKHWIPAWGFDFDSKIPFKKINGAGAAAEGTVEVAAKYSNFELGSRTSMGALFRNWKNPSGSKIGLHFGTFDPPHEGHIDLSRHVLESEGFTESILLPNYTAGHKPGASSVQDRVAMSVARVQDVSPSRIEDRLNVFTGDSSFLMKEFGVGALFARIGALFASEQVWSLIGDDAWDGGILPSGILQPGMIMRYMIFPRGERELQSIHVPEYVKDNTKLVVIPNRKNISSTMIRRMLVNGEAVPQEMMSPAVVRYIQERPHLYR